MKIWLIALLCCVCLLPLSLHAQINNGGGSGLPAGPTSPNGVAQFLCSTPSGGVAGPATYCLSQQNTIVVHGGTNALAGTAGFGTTANTTYIVDANDTESAALAISANSVFIECVNPLITIQFTGATDGFDVSGNNVTIQGCALDHNTQSGAGTGPLIKITAGTGDHFFALNFQNTGTTNAATGTVYMTGGSQVTFRDLIFSGSQTDTCVAVIPPSGTISDVTIESVIVPTFAPASALPCLYGNAANGSVLGTRFLNNTITGTTTGAINYQWVAAASIDDVATKGTYFIGNKSFTTTTSTELMKLFGLSWGTVCSNIIDDQGHSIGQGAGLHLGDFYNSTVCGNVITMTAGSQYGINCIDCSLNAFTGNVIKGIENNTGIFVQTIGQTASQNTISGNTISLAAGLSNCIGVAVTNASGVGNFNNITGNTCVGDNNAGEQGVVVSDVSGGSVQGTYIGNNIFANLTGAGDIGISLSTFVTDTDIGANTFNAVTTKITDSAVRTLPQYVHLTAQTANTGPTTAYAVPALGTGRYQVCASAIATTTGTSWTVPSVSVTWTDNDSGLAITNIIQATVSNPTTGSTANCVYVNAKSSTNIQYTTAGYASTGTAMQYALNFTIYRSAL